LEEVLATGLVQDTGKTCDYGFCKSIPIWKRTIWKGVA